MADPQSPLNPEATEASPNGRSTPPRPFYRTAQVRACDVVPGDLLLDDKVWREVLDVAHDPDAAARIWDSTSMREHAEDHRWTLHRSARIPETPKVLDKTAWDFPHGIAGVAMTGYEGAIEHVAIELLSLASGEVASLTMLAPRASLITIQVAE